MLHVAWRMAYITVTTDETKLDAEMRFARDGQLLNLHLLQVERQCPRQRRVGVKPDEALLQSLQSRAQAIDCERVGHEKLPLEADCVRHFGLTAQEVRMYIPHIPARARQLHTQIQTRAQDGSWASKRCTCSCS